MTRDALTIISGVAAPATGSGTGGVAGGATGQSQATATGTQQVAAGSAGPQPAAGDKAAASGPKQASGETAAQTATGTVAQKDAAGGPAAQSVGATAGTGAKDVQTASKTEPEVKLEKSATTTDEKKTEKRDEVGKSVAPEGGPTVPAGGQGAPAGGQAGAGVDKTAGAVAGEKTSDTSKGKDAGN